MAIISLFYDFILSFTINVSEGELVTCQHRSRIAFARTERDTKCRTCRTRFGGARVDVLRTNLFYVVKVSVTSAGLQFFQSWGEHVQIRGNTKPRGRALVLSF